MRYLIFILSALFFLNAEDLQVDSKLKKPHQIDDDLIFNHGSSKVPKSIIFIIADGAGIGQYTLSYYANQKFSFKQF